jgi:hypothetical protein
MTPKLDKQITEPGAYEWIDRAGVRNVGFITKDSRGRLSGAFISEDGNVRSVSLQPDDTIGNGLYYGPLQLPA